MKLRPTSRRFRDRFGAIDADKALAIARAVERRDKDASVDGELSYLRDQVFPMSRASAYIYLAAGRWILHHCEP